MVRIYVFLDALAWAIVNQQEEIKLKVGNFQVVRDFVGVRDVVREAKGGSIFNVCNGQGMALVDAVDYLSSASGIQHHAQSDQTLVRPLEKSVVVGSPNAITAELGWRPSFTFKQSVDVLLSYWVQRGGR